MSHWLRRGLVLVLLAIGLPSALAAAEAGDTCTLDRPTATQGAKVDGSTLSPAFAAAFAWNGVGHLAGTTSLAGGVVRHAELDPGSGRLSNLTGTIGTTSSGSFAYVWDHARATRRGRLASGSLTTGLAWDWQLDGALRLRSAVTSLPRQPLHRTWAYGLGDADELQSIVDSDGAALHITSGPFGRPEHIGDETLTYDHLGQRLEDRRFTYTWDWRGRLVQVDVKEGADLYSEACGGACDGHRVRYEHDALGRLLTRIHEVPTDTGYQALSTRRFVWDNDTLVAEMALEDDGRPLWKTTHLPGPGGLDDTVTLRLDTNLTATAATAHLALVRDEMGSVIALARDDPDGGAPHLIARVLYTPYGEAHLELGPEPLGVRFDPAITTLDNQQQQIQPPDQPGDPVTAAAGGVWLTTTSPLDPASVAAGLSLVKWNPDLGLWETLPPSAYVAKVEPVTVSLRLMPLAGWTSDARYEVRYGTALTDPSGRGLQVPPTEPPPGDHLRFAVAVATDGSVDAQERRWTPDYNSAAAAGSTLGGIIPGGTTTLFQGLWTDPITGQAHARARVLDTRHGVWLSEDPLELDSPNLYAFVAWQPHMYMDPRGEFAVFAPAIVFGIKALFTAGGVYLLQDAVAQGAEEAESRGFPWYEGALYEGLPVAGGAYDAITGRTWYGDPLTPGQRAWRGGSATVEGVLTYFGARAAWKSPGMQRFVSGAISETRTALRSEAGFAKVDLLVPWVRGGGQKSRVNPRLQTRLAGWKSYKASGGGMDMSHWVKATKRQYGDLSAVGGDFAEYVRRSDAILGGVVQGHHLISRRIARALERRGIGGWALRDRPDLLYPSAPGMHYGYQTWHRAVDSEIVRYIRTTPGLTEQSFLQYLHGLYQRPDLASRIPGVSVRF